MRRNDGLWIAAVALVFVPALLALARVWVATDYYSHGFFVPLVSAWLFADRRRELPEPGRHASGALALAAAVALYLPGLLLADATLQGLALVGAVAGVVLRLYGTAGLAKSAFAVGFLLFMVPLPTSSLTPAIASLQLGVSRAAVEILHAGGATVLREGNVVMLPGGERLFVDEACSGITSIVTLLPLGALLARFTQRSWGRGLLLVAAVVPAAMLGNLVRVLATVAGARSLGAAQVTSGPVHDVAGLLTFLLACGLLLAVGRLLRPPGPALAS